MQASNVSNVTLAPPPAPPKPAPPVHSPQKPGTGRGKWIALIVLISLIAGGLYYWRQVDSAGSSKGAATAIRTAVATQGRLESSIRLTGSTAAERFVSLIAPQLRGSRGGFGRGDRAVVPQQPSSSIQPKFTQITPGGSTRGSMSSSMRSATGRGSASTQTSGGLRSVGVGNSMGSTGLGSTAQQNGMGMSGAQIAAMMGGPGGGGPGGDFGLVLQELVKPGSMVRKNDVVAEFDRTNMLNRLDDYRASLVQAESSFKRQMADLEVRLNAQKLKIAQAKADLDKANVDLKTIPVLGQIDAERLKLNAELAKARYEQYLSEERWVRQSERAQIRNAEIDLEQTRNELKRAEQNADRMLLRAAIDGLTVMQSTFRGGEFSQIQQGDTLMPGQFFMQIVDPSSMVVNASVNQVDAERLRIGAKARVRFDAYPGLELPARVYSVAGITKGGGARASYVKELPVRLKLEKMDPRVIPDLSVSVDVIVDEEDGATMISRAAVFRDQDAKPFVWVEGPQGWTRRDVELGGSSFTQVAVRGLKPGEKVALDRPGAASGAGSGVERASR
jgi:HlyD family secretion protein